MKYDLSKTSIIIHYRKDSPDRTFNLENIFRFINNSFDYHQIIIINDDKSVDDVMFKFKGQHPKIIGLFYQNDGPFRKSDAFNKAVEVSSGDILCFYDVDILIHPRFLEEGQKKILSGKFDHIYPHNGEFITVKKEVFFKILPSFDFDFMLENKTNDNFEWAAGNSPGGCNMISKKAFDKINGYDSRFIGWGFEDSDYRNRSSKLNKVSYISSPDAICWHLQHDNAIKAENPYYIHNQNIYIENLK